MMITAQGMMLERRVETEQGVEMEQEVETERGVEMEWGVETEQGIMTAEWGMATYIHPSNQNGLYPCGHQPSISRTVQSLMH